MMKVALLVIGLLLASPTVGQAEMFDVITLKLHDDCSVATLVKLHNDFNAYAEKNGDVPKPANLSC